jgi:hypothetical protein
MTSVGPTSPDKVRRASHEPPPNAVGPPAKIDSPDHPTLLEIAAREKKIETWDALNVGGYPWAKPGAIVGFLVSAVMMVIALTPIPPNWPWDIPLVILSVFTSVATVVCGLLWFDNPDIGARPESLEIVPFSRAENLRLMQEQAVEPFQAACTCPGCGHASTHRIREPADNEPHWAAATRHCAVCKREWAQA